LSPGICFGVTDNHTALGAIRLPIDTCGAHSIKPAGLTGVCFPYHYPAISTQRACQHVHDQPRHLRFGLQCPGWCVRCRCQEIQETAAHL